MNPIQPLPRSRYAANAPIKIPTVIPTKKLIPTAITVNICAPLHVSHRMEHDWCRLEQCHRHHRTEIRKNLSNSANIALGTSPAHHADMSTLRELIVTFCGNVCGRYREWRERPTYQYVDRVIARMGELD